MKVCSICKADKEASAFNKRARAKDGLRAECRQCQSEAGRRAKARNPAAHNEAAKKRKRAFRERHPNSHRDYYARNVEKESARKKLALQTRGDEIRALRRAAYARNPERQKKATRAWVERNREHVAEYQRLYARAHLPQLNEKSRRRRALKLDRTVAVFAVEDLDARMSVYGHRCAYCGGPFEHVDHVIPLARGGLHCLANLRPACRACNLRKSAKPPGVWFPEVA